MAIFATTLLIWSLLLAAIELHAVPTGRIVGGNNAYNGQFPHQISLRVDNSHRCGGSIITRNYIITAAHCVVNQSPSDLTVRAGSIDRLKNGVLINVSAITIHAEFGRSLNDVALLKLQKPLSFSDYIKPIKLSPAAVPDGETVQLSGWGRLRSSGDIPVILQWTNATVLSRDECKKETSYEKIICLSSPDNRGACDGDSGGPATSNGTLVGISNFTFFRCGSEQPDGYAEVSVFYDWVMQNSDLSEFIKENIEYK